MNQSKHKEPLHYLWWLVQHISLLSYREFKRFFSVPKSPRSRNFWLTTRYHVNSMGLWCAVGAALIYLLYYLIVSSKTASILHIDETAFLLQNYVQLIARVLFTLFLIAWLYVHYAYGRLRQRTSLLLSILFIAGSNLQSMTGASQAFADVWIIMAPIIVIPAVGNRCSLPLLLSNILLHHLLLYHETGQYGLLISIASLFIAIFMMMIQLEYYRREVRLQDSASHLRERILEIELIKENMESGLMLLDLELKVLPNHNDICIKMLHQKNLRDKYFPELLRGVVDNNQHFISRMTMDAEGQRYAIKDTAEWQERVQHYFAMLKAEQLDESELRSIDPLQYVKIYSYEGRSYISFHVSTVKVSGQIKYFMVLISNDTGKVAGRYRLQQHEKRQLERAELLLSLSGNDFEQQLQCFYTFAKSYLALCKNILTEQRSTVPPQQLVSRVSKELELLQGIFQNLHLQDCQQKTARLLRKCEEFGHIEFGHSSNAIIINKSIQTKYMQLVIECEKFLHEMRSFFSIAAFFIREPQLCTEIQKQAAQRELSGLQDSEVADSQPNSLSQEVQMFLNLYAAFDALLKHHDLKYELEQVQQEFSSQEIAT